MNGSLAVASACVTVAAPGGAPLPDLQTHSASADGRYVMGENPFVLLALHEVLPTGWVLWEEDKYVSLSRARFQSVAALAAGLQVVLRGAAGEVVKLVALRPDAASGATEWTVVAVHATIGSDGLASIDIQ